MNEKHITNNGPQNCAIISYQPHNVCNFTCEYCHSSSNGGDQRWNNKYSKMVDLINIIREKNKHAYLEILGGEPTLWPELVAFINKILHENLVIEINSNGSRSLRYWEEFPIGQVIINFSWHSKEVNTDHLYEVVKIMKSKAYVMVTFLLTPDNFNAGLDAVEKFKDLQIELDPRPTKKCIVSSELYDYTEDQLMYIKQFKQDWSKIHKPSWKTKLYPNDVIINNNVKHWHSITINKEHTFTGWSCAAGLDRFIIDPRGNITRCWPGVGGSIGNVYAGYVLPATLITCTHKGACHCKLDAMVEKWSPDV